MADVARKFLQTNLYYAGTLLKDERLCAAVRSRTPVVLAYPKSADQLVAGRHRRPPGRRQASASEADDELLPESNPMVELKPPTGGPIMGYRGFMSIRRVRSEGDDG